MTASREKVYTACGETPYNRAHRQATWRIMAVWERVRETSAEEADLMWEGATPVEPPPFTEDQSRANA
ncbi:MAG: hypothetical protein ACYTG0_45110, partial [Planctomycetota bacterium]